MTGIADSYMELAYGAGGGDGVHSHYRESNLSVADPFFLITQRVAQHLSTW
jgi:hypothetical protein